MVISEKEIELERLKTTVFSLNGKCAIVDDHVEDVRNATYRFNDSENQRQKLQIHIVETSKKVQIDNTAHTDYQNDLIQEITDLKQALEQTKTDHHRALQRKDEEMEQVRTTLTNEKEQMRNQMTKDFESMRNQLQNQLE